VVLIISFRFVIRVYDKLLAVLMAEALEVVLPCFQHLVDVHVLAAGVSHVSFPALIRRHLLRLQLD
jgi:hypothetical protein